MGSLHQWASFFVCDIKEFLFSVLGLEIFLGDFLWGICRRGGCPFVLVTRLRQS